MPKANAPMLLAQAIEILGVAKFRYETPKSGILNSYPLEVLMPTAGCTNGGSPYRPLGIL